jgi:hypothetical protein
MLLILKIYISFDTFFSEGKFNPGVGGSFTSDHQILKRKHQNFIVERDTDEDDEMMDLKNEEIKVESSTKSAKEEALEAFLATGEQLSKRVNNIDRIITSKMTEEEINNKK